MCLSRRVGEIALPGSNKIARNKAASLQSRGICWICCPLGCKRIGEYLGSSYPVDEIIAWERIGAPRFDSAISRSNQNCPKFSKAFLDDSVFLLAT